MQGAVRGFVIAALVSLWSAALFPAQAQQTFPKSELSIQSGDKTHAFTVEIARTTDQRAQGLMWRRKVPRGTGMLFLHPSDRVLKMWMKNTLVPLDMLFIDRTGTIVRIKERTVPHSTAVISSGRKARAVLELAGGTASRLGIKPGDRVRHEAFAER
jgi:uncharacterized membrane protein (UPF0127 family)